ncbi:MAG: hypothetical protein M3N47_05990 [Chloroflexota bacterium]|nr:hypothetical protein [Chloroflexota bacterium]
MLETMNTKTVELAIHCQIATADMVRRIRERAEAEDGQTAAEYIGIILVIVAVIAVVATSGIAATISDGIKDAINDVKGPSGAGPSGGGQAE